MTNKEAAEWFKTSPFYHKDHETFNLAIKALEREECEDAISRQAVLNINFKRIILTTAKPAEMIERKVKALPSVVPQTKMRHCKDCKWWKDSDGVYRRGVGAESQCPINRIEVLEGDGYCYMFEPQ